MINRALSYYAARRRAGPAVLAAAEICYNGLSGEAQAIATRDDDDAMYNLK